MNYNRYFGPEYMAVAYPAYKIKDIIEQNLESSSINSDIKAKLIELDNSLTEESNPVVVIGKLK